MDYLPVSLLTKVGLNASNITTSDSIIVTSAVLTQLVTQLVTQSPVLGIYILICDGRRPEATNRGVYSPSFKKVTIQRAHLVVQ